MEKFFFELINFSFGFKQDAPLFFDNLSIRIPNFGLTCIVGKNAVGKSTFFRILQGIIFPGETISGILKINNAVYDLSKEQDRNILYRRSIIMHQNFDRMLAPSFTGKQNLRFARFSKYPTLGKIDEIDLHSTVIQSFDIPLHRQVRLLSGGHRQMLVMMMVMQRSLDLVLLDEPIAALDNHNSDYLMQGLESLLNEKHICVLAIVHDYDVVQRYAKNLIKIDVDDLGKKTFILQ